MEAPTIDVIVPVFNEAEILELFYKRISALGLPLNLIFVDNASSDDSAHIIQGFSGATLIQHDINEGYGGSLIDGITYSHNDTIIIIDADCEYPPEAIPDILEALQTNDVVYTSRLLIHPPPNMPWLKSLGNQIISGLYNVLFGQSTTDLYTGCKGFKRHCVEGLSFKRKGFEHVLELACLLSRRGYRIVDVPVNFEPRSTGNSKMSHASETLKFLLLILFYAVTTRNEP
ncbi:MAG: glycosyltransferase family 2 protein [Halioglobus sp.]|nr:glycosyltransferase family 2 protein [Halioglobus sp.]